MAALRSIVTFLLDSGWTRCLVETQACMKRRTRGCLCMSTFTDIAELAGIKKMWIAFGQGVHAHMISVHKIASVIGPEKASGG